MKFRFGTVIVLLLLFVNNSCTVKMKENPLLVESTNQFEAPPFDKIEEHHYKPAFLEAIKLGREEIGQIVDNLEAPTFENTIEALELAGERLGSVASLFFNINEANTSDYMQQVALELSPLLTEYSNDIILNEALFKRVKEVYQMRESLNLNQEQMRLTEESYKNFARNGANLEGEAKEQYRQISKELSQLSLKFSQNVLGATNKFFLHLTDSADLEGLPPFIVEGAAAEAEERSLEGWVITLQGPSFGPFMQYSKRRELREKMWMANITKALYDDFDNQENIKSIISLRQKRAELLGYSTHAQYILAENMAGSQERVTNFLEELLSKTLPYATKEVKEIESYAKENGFKGRFMPWDFSYWSEKYKQERYAISDQLLKPYFQLENVEKAVFDLAHTLYGIDFIENREIPIYHPDVKVYEVRDEKGDFLSLLYVDFFPRASKRGGAWMTSFREQSIKRGVEKRPFVSIVMNFTKPTSKSPSLLTFYEVTTLLHEFGHALHGMLAQGSYASLTGTNVVRDFVELPSQIMENWATEPQFLKSFAKHYESGEIIPDELIEKLVAARNYLSGYQNVRQLSFGIIDMAWHTLSNPESVKDVVAFEKGVLERTKLLPQPDSVALSPSFGHIFSGGYSAGYYSYKWAEVLEADAFSLFKERGIFNREVANSFRENILSKGNLQEASTLYRNFRGRDPKPEALLEKFGMK